MSDLKRQIDDSTLTVEKPRLKHPGLFKVFLHNDDYTPMDFVVIILETIFDKNHQDALQIMLTVHKKGLGLCGIYTREVAEHKSKKVNEIATENEYPLKCTMEPE